MVLREPTDLTGLTYVPRSSGSNGNLKNVTLVVTDEAGQEHRFSANNWPNNAATKTIDFGRVIKAKKIVLTGTQTYGDSENEYQSAAELVFNLPTTSEAALDTSAYDKALARAKMLTSQANREAVEEFLQVAAYVTNNHLLTPTRLAEFTTYLNSLEDTPATPPVHKTTPDEGVKIPVVEQPRLDVVTEALPFNTVERENPQLPKGTRKVVQEGKNGEKTTLVEVTIENGQETGRVTRDSFVSKAPVDKIVEIGKPVEQITPAEGVKNLVVEQPRLDIVTEVLPFNTVERENPQLPKGTRKVVKEGKAGEKTTLVEVTIENGQETGRVTRDSFVSKDPVDQIVEVGSKEEKPNKPTTPEKPVEPSKPENNLRILTDEATKVQVIGMKSTLDQVVALKVKKVAAQSLEGKLYDAYDIRLEDQFGKAVQPKGKVFVSLPVASNKDVENVFFMTAADQLDAVSFQQKGHYIEYMTDQLGVYAVVYKSTATPQVQEQVHGAKVDGSTKGQATKSATLPSTGTATDSAFLLGLLLALTGLFLMKKKENM